MTSHRLIATLVIGLATWFAPMAPVDAAVARAAAAAEAVQVVAATSDEVLTQILARPSAERNIGEIESLIARIVLPHVDVEAISRRVLGRYWKTATRSDRDAVVNGLRKAIVATYAHALRDLEGADIEYLSPRVSRNGRQVIVRSHVRVPNGHALSVHYRLIHEGDWKLIDLVVAGVSFVATYRSSLLPALRRGGIERVVNLLSTHSSNEASSL